MKKVKNTFDDRPIPSHPTPSNSGKALVLRIEHWTLKGDYGSGQQRKKFNIS